jgi:hypothetical protein
LAFSITIVRPADFIRYDSHQRPSLAAGREAMQTIGRMCQERGIDRILIDSREVIEPLKVPELYMLAAALADIEFPRHIWIALLPRMDVFDRAEFFSLCAANRGWIARPFRSFEEAVLWMAGIEPEAESTHAAPVITDDS